MIAAERREALAERRLMLLLTRELCAREPLGTLRAALMGGVDCVQLREKPFGEDALEWIAEARGACDEFGALCFINDELELARASGAFGLHLGQEDLANFAACDFVDRDFALGISTHDLDELARARREAPDYVGVGPCFATWTKGLANGLDDAALGALVEASEGAGLPAFAIGGISAKRVPRLVALGVRRVAVSSAILQASDPRAASEGLGAALGH